MKTGSDDWTFGATSREQSQVAQEVCRIGQGSRVIGTLLFEGEATISGAVEGEIKSSGCLAITSSAVVAANIRGEHVKVAGRFDGVIEASEKIELLAGACVSGTIVAPRVVIQDGVIFEGRCRMPKEEEPEEHEVIETFSDEAFEG